MLVMNFLGDAISYGFHWILLWIDSVVYWAASKCYQLFMMIATARIFEDEFFANFARRIYAILGVFMLFYLAYALLNAIVDPDKYSKGEKGVGNIAVNFVISLVILGLVPTIFSYAYRVQNFILSEDVLGTVILGTKLHDIDENATIKFGDSVSFSVLNTFINPYNVPTSMGKSAGYTWFDCKKIILEESDYFCLTGLANPYVYKNDKDDIKYYGIISTIVGGYLVYLLFSFALDLGVRVIKLAFYQLIAPIPIIMRALPSKKTSFDKWLKKTLATYADVFVRVGFMYMSVYFISRIVTNTDIAKYLNNGFTGLLVLTILIIGIFTFAKQASKEISDILGVDAKINMGIKDKLKAGGPLGNLINNSVVNPISRIPGAALGTVTGAAGGAWTSMANGNGLWEGIKYGAIKGSKNGGLQFNKQRQGLYETFGGKGRAGWFGSRGLIDRISADTIDHVKDNYRDKTLPERLKNAESSQDFMTIFNKQLNEMNAKRAAERIEAVGSKEAERDRLINQMNAAKHKYKQDVSKRYRDWKAEQDSKIKSLQDQMTSEQEQYNTEKKEKLDALWAQFREAPDYSFEKLEIQKKIDELNGQSYSNQSLQVQIDSAMSEKFVDKDFDDSAYVSQISKINQEIKDYDSSVAKADKEIVVDGVTGKEYTALEYSALKSARKEYRDKHVHYSDELRTRSARVSEKGTKEWLDSEEGQRQVAAYGAAQERINSKNSASSSSNKTDNSSPGENKK